VRAQLDQTGDGQDLELLAREVSLMRRRGRLLDAHNALDALEDEIRQQGLEVSATWRGRLLYERAIIVRLRGDIGSARQCLGSIDTESAAIVGANWSMWLEDEKCALSIWREEVEEAERHLARARQLAIAYGEHRLATVDLAVRNLQLSVIKEETVSRIRHEIRSVKLAALRHRILTPMRRAWLNGIDADAARRAGDIETAVSRYQLLRKSPHLMHPLAATAGILACGEPLPSFDIGNLVAATGPSSTEGLIEELSSRPQGDPSVHEWAERLRGGRGFVFLS
jgi:hypothetical protein